MSVSNNFFRFIFGVVLEDLHNSGGVLTFQEPPFKFRVSAISKESIRNLLKHLDFNYPRDENEKPLSYTKLDSKQMTEHISWIERQCAFSGIEMRYISQEWERIMSGIRYYPLQHSLSECDKV